MANYLGSLPGQDEALTNNPGSNLDSFYTDENWKVCADKASKESRDVIVH